MSTQYDLNLSEELIPVGKRNRPGTLMTPKFITVHNTDNTNAGADADAHSRFVRKTGYYMWKGKKRWVSWHFTVDDVEVIKQLPLNEVGYHAGKGNSVSIAIEQCMHKGIDVAAADERLAQLLASLCADLGLGTDKIVTHKHWTGKPCPSQLLGKWDELIDRVDEILGATPTRNPLLLSASELNFQDTEKLFEGWLAEIEQEDMSNISLNSIVATQ